MPRAPMATVSPDGLHIELGWDGPPEHRVQAQLARDAMRSMIVWVLDNNHHARRFYEAMGGRMGSRLQSTVGGFPVIELSYVWDRF